LKQANHKLKLKKHTLKLDVIQQKNTLDRTGKKLKINKKGNLQKGFDELTAVKMQVVIAKHTK